MQKGEQRFAHCKGVSGSHGCGVHYWNAWEQGKLGATAPADPQINPPGFCDKKRQPAVSSIGTKLAEIIQRETGHEIPCSECKADIASLNLLTTEEAIERRAEYISRISSRVAGNVQGLLQRLMIAVDTAIGTNVLAIRIGEWFDLAIEQGADPADPIVVEDRKRRRRIYSPHLAPPTKRTTPEQNRLFRIARSVFPNPRVIAGDVRKNLVWHFWPVRGGWEWHADNVREMLESKAFDGQVIIGVSTDSETDSLSAVRDRIGNCRQIDWIETENISHHNATGRVGKRFGELQTAIPAMDMLISSPDSVTFYGHAKGVQDHTIRSEPVRMWSEMMYETVMFNQSEVLRLIESGFDAVGSFRTFGLRPLMAKHSWHYSGTFYAFRTQAMKPGGVVRPYQLRYGGTESWLGDHIRPQMSACVFEDNSPMVRQYDLDLMVDLVAAQMQWESDRFDLGGRRIEQHFREFNWFLSQLDYNHKSMLVIGSKSGGVEMRVRQICPWVRKIVSCDLVSHENTLADALIVGDSHSHEVQNLIRQHGPFDVVFIDGDHSEEGCRLEIGRAHV